MRSGDTVGVGVRRRTRNGPSLRRRKLIWKIVKWSGLALLGIFILYCIYIIGYKTWRCTKNKDSNKMSFDICMETLENPRETIETREKAYRNLNCPDVVKKSKRSCLWHGIYSLYNKLYEGIVYLCTSSLVWVTVIAASLERLYRYKNMAQEFMDFDEDDDGGGGGATTPPVDAY
jgi:hypothetical protein